MSKSKKNKGWFTKQSPDEAWFAKHFPTTGARAKADAAVDTLDVTLSMTVFLDTWIAEYIQSGGATKLRLS